MATLTNDMPIVMPLSPQRVLTVFSGLLLVMLLAALDATIVATALPTVAGELGGLSRISWIITAYLLAETIATPLWGKLGDLYGRKGILQAAVVLFLIGSALCGLSRSMTELILFRAIQGLGGGALMVTTQAAVGDIVSPRQRGRYQGFFGAAFGLASVAGPLLGGFFTTNLSWRWIFYINLPVGILAMVIIAITFPAQARRVSRSIDYAGASFLGIALASLVLLTDLGGITYPWTSFPILGLLAAAVVAAIVFGYIESYAQEPILPLRLFLNKSFWVTTSLALVVGFAMFGSVTCLPLFLQLVKGESPTASGLHMLPYMIGIPTTSLLAGQFISWTGRYKILPLAGTAVTALSLFLLSRMTPATSLWAAGGSMLLLGIGLGLILQVLVIAVQNAVDYRDLGVATSGAILFRFIGGSIGTAILGAIFAARLQNQLGSLVPGGLDVAANALNPHMLDQLPPALQMAYRDAFAAALSVAFLVAAGIMVVGFILACILPELPLRQTIAAASGGNLGNNAGQSFAMHPADSDSMTQLLRGLSVLADRDVKRRYIQLMIERAHLELSPAAAWLLLRLEADPCVNLPALARSHKIELSRLQAADRELLDKALVVETASHDGDICRKLTDDGCRALHRLVVARRSRLEELFREWAPDKRTEVARALQWLAKELVPNKHEESVGVEVRA